MNRLEKHFAELKARHEKALILYITAGDPSLAETFDIMKGLAAGGADCIELGVPFSDPIADGPVIQKAGQRALKNKINLHDILGIAKTFRQSYDTPLVMMGYYNPILRFGLQDFAKACKEHGIDGLIVADLPFEEGEEFEAICWQNGISLIYLLAPEMGNERTKSILQATSGFVYCVAYYGTTGTAHAQNGRLDDVVSSIKSMTDLPVAVGFGIDSCESAKEKANAADGIIIGSWLISELEKSGEKGKTALEFAGNVKKAIE